MGYPDEVRGLAPTDEDTPPAYEKVNNSRHNADAYSPWAPAPSNGVGSKAGPVSGVRIRFPPTINAYWKLKFSKTFYLGEKQDEPALVGRLHTGMTKNPQLVLYEGLDDKGPILATADRETVLNTLTTIITIPAYEGVGHDTEHQRIEMRTHYRGLHLIFTMVANVGAGKETRREEFEWRSSHGSEVEEVHGWSWGWKLVRISNEPLGGGDREARALGSTSDGHEVIAAWAFNKTMSLTKYFKFQLMGSALMGILGERGATLALVSALRVFVLEYNHAAGRGLNPLG